jgi:hypothetical protein
MDNNAYAVMMCRAAVSVGSIRAQALTGFAPWFLRISGVLRARKRRRLSLTHAFPLSEPLFEHYDPRF